VDVKTSFGNQPSKPRYRMTYISSTEIPENLHIFDNVGKNGNKLVFPDREWKGFCREGSVWWSNKKDTDAGAISLFITMI
jgi:hypothetical protein